MLYKLKFYLQVFLWICGYSTHFNEECTIDFSCCYPNLKRPLGNRINITLGRIVYGYWTRLIKK